MPKRSVEPVLRRARLWRALLYVVLTSSLTILIFLQWTNIRLALVSASRAEAPFVVAGIAAMAASVGFASWLYVCLVPALRLRPTLLVQTAGLFANKLLPAGSGAAGVSFLYLRAQRVANGPAAATVACNNALGFLGHITLLLCMVLLSPGLLTTFTSKRLEPNTALVAIAVLAAVVGVGLYIAWRRKLRFVRKIIRAFKPVMSPPSKLPRALLVSMGITASYMVCVLFCAKALGVELSLAESLVALSVSVFASSAIPTPGGIGGAEAGLYAGLVLLDVPTGPALAIAFLYRFVSFWLPLMVGGVAFLIVNQRRLLRLR